MTLLGTVDLLAQGNDDPTSRNMADALPPLTSNVEADYYYVQATDDGDELSRFLQEGWLDVGVDLLETPVFENTTGTEESDWLTAQASGLTLDGAGGQDILGANANNVTLIGGAGLDIISSADDVTGTRIFGGAGDDEFEADFATIDGGEGNDKITAGSSEVFGGAGNDRLNLSGVSTGYGGDGDDSLVVISETDATTIYGGDGNDSMFGRGTGTGVFGDAGDDDIRVRDGATAYGGVGDDLIAVNAGSTGFGGDGDDTIRLFKNIDSIGDPAIVSGGEGADTFDFRAFAFTESAPGALYAQIEDFDTAEDVLVIRSSSFAANVDEIRIIEDPDGAFTDVEITFESNRFDDIGPSLTTIRLTGTTGVTSDHVMQARS